MQTVQSLSCAQAPRDASAALAAPLEVPSLFSYLRTVCVPSHGHRSLGTLGPTTSHGHRL